MYFSMNLRYILYQFKLELYEEYGNDEFFKSIVNFLFVKGHIKDFLIMTLQDGEYPSGYDMDTQYENIIMVYDYNASFDPDYKYLDEEGLDGAGCIIFLVSAIYEHFKNQLILNHISGEVILYKVNYRNDFDIDIIIVANSPQSIGYCQEAWLDFINLNY